MGSEMRLRFAPSPTGPIHVGNAHTMLFNWLWARHQGGKFVLRFEDTDQARSRPEWAEVIYNEMKWLGLDWDEGPDIGGPYAPYNQMGRLDLYVEYFNRLKAAGAVYECYCTPDELAAERKEFDAKGVPYKYTRRCLHLSEAEKEKFRAEGRTPAWRFRVPDNQVVGFDDMVRGRIEFPTHSIGDFVVMRSNGIPLYNFAVVVDDITMKITHVIRGEGHISNTPVQLLIYQALGEPAPAFAHVSHLLTAERGKMSKRKGDAAVTDFREKGILGEAMFNFLALLGWTPKDDRELMTREEIVREFNIHDVNKAAAVFDMEKLEWMNGVYIRQLTVEEFAERALPFVVGANLTTEADLRARWDWFVEVMAQVQARTKTLGEIPPYVDFFFNDDLVFDEKAVEKFLTPDVQPFFRRAIEAFTNLPAWDIPSVEGAVRGLMEEMNLQPKQSMQPMRVAMTGRTASPGLFETVYLIGRERAIQRLRKWA